MKSSKELFGFDDRPWLLLGIVSTAILFPYVFLENNLADFQDHLVFSLSVGLIYSGGMFLVNRAIIFKFIEARKVAGKSHLLKVQLALHFIFTFCFALLMSWACSNAPSGYPFTVELAFRNIAGCLTLLGITAGIYEGNFWFNEWKSSVAEQERLRRENIQSQLETLKNQVNPHFLFNSLNTLVSIIPDDPELAVNYVKKLSKVYRYILLIKDKRLVSLAEELECIEAYVFMNQIRFGNNFSLDLRTDGVDEKMHVVPLSLQILIENAIKHNVISNKKPLVIEIFPAMENAPSLIVRNKLQLKSNVASSTGTGLENIRSRYEILSKRTIDVMVSDNYFTVAIPLIPVTDHFSKNGNRVDDEKARKIKISN